MEVISDVLGASTMAFTKDDPEAKEVFERLKGKEVGAIHLHVYRVQGRGLSIRVDMNELKDVGDEALRNVIPLAAMEAMTKQVAIAAGAHPAELAKAMSVRFLLEEMAQIEKEGKQ